MGSTCFEVAQPIAKRKIRASPVCYGRVGTAVSEGECRAGTRNETHGWGPLPDGVHVSREGGVRRRVGHVQL